jgi:hypothetical protein
MWVVGSIILKAVAQIKGLWRLGVLARGGGSEAALFMAREGLSPERLGEMAAGERGAQPHLEQEGALAI